MKRPLVLAAILSGFAATLWPQNNWPQLFVRDMNGILMISGIMPLKIVLVSVDDPRTASRVRPNSRQQPLGMGGDNGYKFRPGT